MEENIDQSFKAGGELMAHEEGASVGVPAMNNKSEGIRLADGGHEFFTMPGFTLTECSRKDEEDNYVDFSEDSESDTDTDTGESEGEAGSSDAVDVEIGAGDSSGRTRKRKRTKKKNKDAVSARKAARRNAEAKNMSSLSLLHEHAPKERLRARILHTREDIACPTLHGITGGYIGHKAPARSDVLPTLETLLASGYRRVEAGSHAVAVVDSMDRVVITRVRRPAAVAATILDKINPLINELASLKLSKLSRASTSTRKRAKGTTSTTRKKNTRGDFVRVQWGYHHGTGSLAPHLMRVKGKRVRAKLYELLDSPGMVSLLNHVRASLMTWFPNVATHLAEQHDLIKAKLPDNQTNPHLWGSPFTTTTLNLGPRTITCPHRDAGNVQPGLCAIFVLGSHKAVDGGSLVLDEARMVMELEAGDMAIFPSALITHWNTTLKPDAVRQSIVFWTCGQSIRYYHMGERLMKSLNKEEKEAEVIHAEEYWQAGVQRFSSRSQLVGGSD